MGKDIDTGELWAEEASRNGRAHSRFGLQLVILGSLGAGLLVTCSYVPVLLA